jgi:hypothetical protein
MAKKRKLSAYNRFVRTQVKAGRSFAQAARAWKGGTRRLKTRRSAVKRRATSMPRRRRPMYARARRSYTRYRSAGGGTLMRGLIPVPRLLSSALLGAGVALVQQKFLPQVIPYQGAAAAFAVGGLPGAVGAIALGFLGNGQQQFSGGVY